MWVWIIGGISFLILLWVLMLVMYKSKDPAGASFVLEAIIEIFSAIAGGL